MKKTMIKFCDERNRRFCIRTVIAEDEKTKEKFVFKSSIYPEGEKHIRNIVDNADLLKKVYPEVGICPVRMTDHNQVQFEYIKGRSLADFYQEAVLHNDREEIQRLLKIHADLLKGSSENICEFEMTSQFQEVFGLDEWNGDKRALKTSNFDGNSNNIIYQGDKPFFIDYEWVFDFPIPEEIVIFYNLRYVYLNIKGVDALYPMHEAKRMLNISIDDELIEKISWSFFLMYIRKKME